MRDNINRGSLSATNIEINPVREQSSRYDSRLQQEKNKENAVEKREMGKCSRLNACAMGQQQEAEQCTERVGSFPLWPRPFDLMVTKLDISHESTQL